MMHRSIIIQLACLALVRSTIAGDVEDRQLVALTECDCEPYHSEFVLGARICSETELQALQCQALQDAKDRLSSFEECSEDKCGAGCTTLQCAKDCTGQSCGMQCDEVLPFVPSGDPSDPEFGCAVKCAGSQCGASCKSHSCAYNCEGEDCGAECKGEICALKCKGKACGAKCTGQGCGGQCSGENCACECTGAGCGKDCTGKDCGPESKCVNQVPGIVEVEEKPGGERHVDDCFPGDAQVELQNGTEVTMSALNIGDSVRVGASEFSEIFLFTHRDADVKANVFKISTSTGKAIRLTGGHYLFVNGQLQTARTVKLGDMVSSGSVTAIDQEWTVGLYNPHTMTGDIVVDGVLASTYTDAVAPSVAHALFWPVRMLYNVGLLQLAGASESDGWCKGTGSICMPLLISKLGLTGKAQEIKK